ncbi:MAG: endopeptidase La [Deltaproteobacteria bacterium]|nr:MAG: endopeptidase La [Deltaproteobacteria bacterium]
MSDEPSRTRLYPLMPLRGIVIFPHMVAPLVVGRKKSIQALEDAMEKRTGIFMVAQKDAAVNEPDSKSIYQVGTVVSVMQLLRLPDGTIKALVEGQVRAEIVSHNSGEGGRQVEVRELPDEVEVNHELLAHERKLRLLFKEYADNNKKIAGEVIKSVAAIEEPGRLLNVICAHLPLKTGEKQQLLEEIPFLSRMIKVIEVINREIELAAIEKDLNTRVKKRMSKTQRNYYLGEKIKEIRTEMGQGGGLDEMSELEESIKNKMLPAHALEKVSKELKKLRSMPPTSAETTVVRNYIDAILGLPWQKKSRSKIDINKAEKILNEDHFGLHKTKERILEYLAVQVQVKKIKGPILCLVGPPGVGKTSICKSIARAMGRKFSRLSLGGVRDEAEIRGHRRTYIGAMPGKIIQTMQKVGTANPVICLDEVDKMSTDFRGDPSSALLEVLDPEQNFSFNDHYLDLDYDLSEVFFITTANSLHSIPGPLRDRMEVIQISGYMEEDKVSIADGYLVPKQLKANGFKAGDITFYESAILEIVRRYTREAGVRNLERSIASVCRKVARDRLKKKQKNKKYRLGAKSISRYLGTPLYRFGLAEDKDRIGLSTGLAWTEVGGELLQIESTLMAGNGKLSVTGKLGEVMKESAQAALSYVRSRALSLGLDPDFYQKIDIHIHIPAVAIPKDGPSAGITIATSLISALLKKPVRHDLAMTGEITLRGRVLPIGGLTEKLLAAKRGNITRVLVPKENEPNLADVPMKIKKSLQIDLVEHVDEVLEFAIIIGEDEALFKDVPLDMVYNDITVSTYNTPH